MAESSSSEGILPASESLVALTITMNRIVVSPLGSRFPSRAPTPALLSRRTRGPEIDRNMNCSQKHPLTLCIGETLSGCGRRMRAAKGLRHGFGIARHSLRDSQAPGPELARHAVSTTPAIYLRAMGVEEHEIAAGMWGACADRRVAVVAVFC